ncbi:hypothetical protein [Flavobacterium sp. HSC-61S13]|uniref:hypothetical protein n=1 Tax=Flavobacterium sp. HSC-61S13 TaxID=2910963 RepID=UPI0020A0E5C1|nr:hypothetical protein [Flavobacterium sp. HSC-61S13]MCP1996628.1 hypothetical protein [Flavobacterium sp. HSC-61S13]
MASKKRRKPESEDRHITIFEEAVILKNEAMGIIPSLLLLEQEKLNNGFTWQKRDHKTRVLTKKET